jgi:hypothetical protein
MSPPSAAMLPPCCAVATDLCVVFRLKGELRDCSHTQRKSPGRPGAFLSCDVQVWVSGGQADFLLQAGDAGGEGVDRRVLGRIGAHQHIHAAPQVTYILVRGVRLWFLMRAFRGRAV